MRKTLSIAFLSLILLSLLGVYLYDRYIGFARESIDHLIPADAYASLSIPHLRHTAIRLKTDKQLQAFGLVFQSIAKTIADAKADELADDDLSLDIEFAPETFAKFIPHFKTQLALSALPSDFPDSPQPGFLLVADFFGEPIAFTETIVELAGQANAAGYNFVLYSQNDALGNFYHYIPIADSILLPNGQKTQPLSLAWAVKHEILYLASHESYLLDILATQTNSPTQPTPSSDLGHLTSSPDIIIRINAPNTLSLISQLNAIQQKTAPNLLAGTNLPKLFDGLGLSSVESIVSILSFDDSRQFSLSAKLNQRTGIWSAFHPADQIVPEPFETNSIQSSTTLAVNLGELAQTFKTALLQSTPVASVSYFFANRSLQKQTGFTIDPLLSDSFANNLTLRASLEVAQLPNEQNNPTPNVIPDIAFSAPLLANNPLTAFLSQQARTPTVSFFDRFESSEQPDFHYLFLDRDQLPQTNGDNLAIAYNAERLVVGTGSLKNFYQLVSTPEFTTSSSSNPSVSGNGILVLDDLPSTLFELATVFYRQLNPDKPIPEPFLSFDWNQLEILELSRSGFLFDQGETEIHWISEQLD